MSISIFIKETDKKSRDKDLKDEMYKMTDRYMKDIVFNRAVAEVLFGVSNDEYDAYCDTLWEQYKEEFKDMDEGKILKHMVDEINEMTKSLKCEEGEE